MVCGHHDFGGAGTPGLRYGREHVCDDADECHFPKAAPLHHEHGTQRPGDLPLADFRDSHRPGRQEDR